MQPRCKKCGKVLTDPASIARGMGPECSGCKPVATRRHNSKVHQKSKSSQAYAAFTRSERTLAFASGAPVEVGQTIFTRTTDGRWLNSTTGGTVDDARMGDWLYRHGFINRGQS